MAGMEEGAGAEDIGLLVENLYDLFVKSVLSRLLEIPEETKRYLYFLSWLNKELEERGLGRIIITGGFAVEVYTGRVYRTMDVDIIVEGADAVRLVENFLIKFSERIGRGYLPRYEVLQLKSIDIVSLVYRKKAPLTKLFVESLCVYVEPVEELVVTYLAGWKYWNATEDRDKALWLYITWRDRIDLSYLTDRSKEEGVADYLELLGKIVS
ncbi:MAG: hypothetical protein QXP80_03955 [Zestosphaera sp.]